MRYRHGLDHRDALGSAMVLVGLGFFVTVFVALFPVLTNPSGAYDKWFPPAAEEPLVVEQSVPTTNIGPTAQFRWEAIVVQQAERPVYRVRLTSESIVDDAPIVATEWTLGDGTQAAGDTVTHDYDAMGSYTISMRVEDSTGSVDTVRGSVSVVDTGSIVGSVGQIEDALDFDRTLDTFGDDISDSLEGAVGDVGDEITDTLDSALGSIGSTVRGGVVVLLFALASLAATVVAWRIARIGVMLLVRDADAPTRRSSLTEDDRDEERPPTRNLEAA